MPLLYLGLFAAAAYAAWRKYGPASGCVAAYNYVAGSQSPTANTLGDSAKPICLFLGGVLNVMPPAGGLGGGTTMTAVPASTVLTAAPFQMTPTSVSFVGTQAGATQVTIHYVKADGTQMSETINVAVSTQKVPGS